MFISVAILTQNMLPPRAPFTPSGPRPPGTPAGPPLGMAPGRGAPVWVAAVVGPPIQVAECATHMLRLGIDGGIGGGGGGTGGGGTGGGGASGGGGPSVRFFAPGAGDGPTVDLGGGFQISTGLVAPFIPDTESGPKATGPPGPSGSPPHRSPRPKAPNGSPHRSPRQSPSRSPSRSPRQTKAKTPELKPEVSPGLPAWTPGQGSFEQWISSIALSRQV